MNTFQLILTSGGLTLAIILIGAGLAALSPGIKRTWHGRRPLI